MDAGAAEHLPVWFWRGIGFMRIEIVDEEEKWLMATAPVQEREDILVDLIGAALSQDPPWLGVDNPRKDPHQQKSSKARMWIKPFVVVIESLLDLKTGKQKRTAD